MAEPANLTDAVDELVRAGESVADGEPADAVAVDDLARGVDRKAGGIPPHQPRDADEFAARSHQLTAAAWDAGFYDNTPISVPATDLTQGENLRRDTEAIDDGYRLDVHLQAQGETGFFDV